MSPSSSPSIVRGWLFCGQEGFSPELHFLTRAFQLKRRHKATQERKRNQAVQSSCSLHPASMWFPFPPKPRTKRALCFTVQKGGPDQLTRAAPTAQGHFLLLISHHSAYALHPTLLLTTTSPLAKQISPASLRCDTSPTPPPSPRLGLSTPRVQEEQVLAQYQELNSQHGFQNRHP